MGLDDIDNMFSSLATAINPFVETRESLQAAKESFENIVKKILNFEAKKELKGGFYLKLAQNIVFLFSSEMRGSTIRLYTDDRFYRKILKYK